MALAASVGVALLPYRFSIGGANMRSTPAMALSRMKLPKRKRLISDDRSMNRLTMPSAQTARGMRGR